MYWCHWLTHACSIRTSWSLFLNGLKYSLFFFLLSWCFTSMEARWPIRDGDRVGSGRQSEGSTAETARKRPERPWTAARTMEVLRRCPLDIAQRLVSALRSWCFNCRAWAESQGQCPLHCWCNSRPIICMWMNAQSSGHSSGAVWESRWPSWAVRPNEPSGFRGRKAILNHASALVTACP